MRTHSSGSLSSSAAIELDRAVHQHRLSGGDAELRQQARIHPRARRPRIRGLLQRRRAAHQRIGEVHRHVGNSLDARRRASPPPPTRSMRLESSDATSRPPRHAARTCSMVSKSKPGLPSRLPSTRSTFQPGRVSPSGFTVACEALHPAFGVDEAARGLGEGRDRQQHVGVVEVGLPGAQADHEVGVLRAPARAARASAQSSSGSTLSSRKLFLARARCRQVHPRVGNAGEVAADRVGRFAEDAERRFDAGQRLRRGVDLRRLRVLQGEVAEEHGGVLAARQHLLERRDRRRQIRRAKRPSCSRSASASRRPPNAARGSARRAWRPGAGGAR